VRTPRWLSTGRQTAQANDVGQAAEWLRSRSLRGGGWLGGGDSYDEACDTGARFKQDAIYFVDDGVLYVSHCNDCRSPVKAALGPKSDPASRAATSLGDL
jgi:hypothetical protein